jgi:hypothetical protein
MHIMTVKYEPFLDLKLKANGSVALSILIACGIEYLTD